MSEDRDRRAARAFQTKTPIEREMESTIADLILGKEPAEPIRTGKKIITTADSQTTITYELSVNKTGQQEVVEHISTNKKECPVCRSHVTTLYTCGLCGKSVCGRHYGSIDILDRHERVVYDDWNDTDWLGGPKTRNRWDPIYRHVGVCSNCYFAKTGKHWEQD